MRLNRPIYLAPLIVIGLLVACTVVSPPHVATTPTGTVRGESAVAILAWHDLPRNDRRSQELSGLSWDGGHGALYAISDDAPMIVRMGFTDGFSTLSFVDELKVTTPGQWDGEGIAWTTTGFFISNEVGPRIFELNETGRMVAEVPLPAHFNRSRVNQSLESLSLTEDGRYLFTANEQALEGDGPRSTQEAGTVVRVLRYDRTTQESQEWAYQTDPIFASGGGDSGVADLAALSATELLVLERSFVPNVGNSVRIYRVSLDEAASISETNTISSHTAHVSKSLFLDLATLPDADFPTPFQPQPNKILDNFEGIALGPALPDGRRVIFLVSDNNKRATQIPRLLVLAASELSK